MKLNAAARKKIPAAKFAGPGRSFPLTDKTHDRMAIGGATRSERAGNISAGTAARIKAKARKKLGPAGGSKTTGSRARGQRPGGDTWRGGGGKKPLHQEIAEGMLR